MDFIELFDQHIGEKVCMVYLAPSKQVMLPLSSVFHITFFLQIGIIKRPTFLPQAALLQNTKKPPE